MFSEIAAGSDKVEAGVDKNDWMNDKVRAGGVFTVECFDKDGNLKWKESAHNLVVNVGLQDMNDKYFDGSAYTATWYLGLVTGPGGSNTYAAGDTLGAHAGWTEFSSYTGNRKSVTWNGATLADPSVMSNSSSASSFAITGSGTVAGAFLASVDTGTSGILFSVSNFQSPGDRTVANGDTLNVTYTFSLDAA
jgi:hypothetical protein